jgi:branched-chain amino acid aminotransferase
VLELAATLGLTAREAPLALHDLYNADECFLTGTGAELVPVVALDGRAIGGGRPGPRTNELRRAFEALRVTDGETVVYPVEAAAGG